jgi:hypothetical protein
MAEFFIATLFTILFYGSAAYWIVRLTSPRFSGFLTGLLLVIAWLLTLILSIFIIGFTPLEDLSWGHAGEIIIVSHVIVGALIFLLAMSKRN